MAAHMMFAVAFLYFIARTSQLRLMHKHLNAGIQLRKVFIALLSTPVFLGVACVLWIEDPREPY